MKTQSSSTVKNVAKTLSLLSLCLVFSLIANTVQAQDSQRTISGVVNSNDGPLLGATVALKGTSQGVMTNEKGEFVFPEQLQENDVLVVSYLGYETTEVVINSNSSFLQPFLEDIPVVIIASLRTKGVPKAEAKNKN